MKQKDTIKINEFAFCFFSSDVNDVIRQESDLISLVEKYQIEKWYRHVRNKSRYVSFSQMVNDAIDDTDSEFMIFCNPKTYFKSSDIEFIVEKLSNGYCFASVVSFGLFGFSKELIRHIGMLDERFIGGEWEDDDFAIRLKHLSKAAWWGYDYSKYDSNWSKSGNMKHITRSIFNQKYEINENTIEINSNWFSHKKISKRHRKNNTEISNSWLDITHSGGNGKMYDYLKNYDTVVVNKNTKEIIADFNFILERNNNNYRVELLSNSDIKLHIVFTSYLLDGRKFLWGESVNSNTWKTFNFKYDNKVEVRLYLEDNQIYNTIIPEQHTVNLKFSLPVNTKIN
jgi:hypothetical protein